MSKSVRDYLGPWKGEITTGLMERCKESWEVPLSELSDLMVITYLNQDIAKEAMLIEARRRLDSEERDGSELYDGQLQERVLSVKV